MSPTASSVNSARDRAVSGSASCHSPTGDLPIIAIQLRHSEIEEAVEALEANPSVLLVEECAGSTGDLLCRVAATSTDDLQQVVHSILRTPGVISTTTSVVLTTRVPYRVRPLLAKLHPDA